MSSAEPRELDLTPWQHYVFDELVRALGEAAEGRVLCLVCRDSDGRMFLVPTCHDLPLLFSTLAEADWSRILMLAREFST